MEQISYSLPIRRFGKILVVVLDKKFEDAMQIKDGDAAIPAIVKYTQADKERLSPDAVVGQNYLCLVIQKRQINNALDMVVVMGDEK